MNKSELQDNNVIVMVVYLELNPIALRMAKTLWSFGRTECKRVKYQSTLDISKCPVYQRI